MLLLVTFCFGQKRADPTPEEIAQAKELRKVYGEDDLVLLNSSNKITFELIKDETKVRVIDKVNEEIMNINARTDIQKYVFYDGESEIVKFNLKYRTKKNAFFSVKEESFAVDDLFHNDAKVKYAHVDFPVQGYKYFFETVKHINDIKYFTSLYFTDDYPVENKEITLIVPKWLNLEIKEMNFDGYDITKETSFDAKRDVQIITYKAKGLEAIYKEEKSPGPSYIYPHLLILSKSFTSNGTSKTLFNETKDLYNWYKLLVNSMDEDVSFLQEKVVELTNTAATDEEKVKNIFYWIQDNIRYIAFEDGIAGFKPDESQNVFKKRYGDCKGMANLTKQMLTLAGFDARLTWIGTNRIAYDYSTPSLSVDNHMICTLFENGNMVFLDGTEKYSAYKEYAERIQGQQVLIEDGDSFILETIPHKSPEMNKETFTFKAKIKNDAIEGDVTQVFKGESRASFLYYYSNVPSDKKNEALSYFLNNDNKNLLVDTIQTSDLENREADLVINYSLKQKNAVASFDDEMYINLDFDKHFGKSFFKERNTDVVFNYKNHFSYQIDLEIPEGYRISELPSGIDIETNDYKIFVDFKEKENQLFYKKTFILKNAIVKKSNFKDWDEAITILRSIYNQQIVLVKK
jgi:transglutaminase-like putative cysteine protease